MCVFIKRRANLYGLKITLKTHFVKGANKKNKNSSKGNIETRLEDFVLNQHILLSGLLKLIFQTI